MKRLIIIIATVCSAALAYGSATTDNLAQKKYAEMIRAKQIVYENDDLIRDASIEDLKALYLVAKNAGKHRECSIIVDIAYCKGDKTLFLQMFDDFKINNIVNTNPHATGYFQTNILGYAIDRMTYSQLEPTLMFQFCKDHPQVEKAIYLLDGINLGGKSDDVWPYSNNAEWHEFIKSTFTPSAVVTASCKDNLRYMYYVRALIMYFKATKDFAAIDSLCTDQFLKYLATFPLRLNIDTYVPANRLAYLYQSMLDNHVSVEACIKACKALDANDPRKAATHQQFAWFLENARWNDLIDIAMFSRDNDLMIDAFKKLGHDATPLQIMWMIQTATSIDANYRKDEVLAILKNINQKYTLKLYDDHDKWEPILSKVRALMDVIQ